MKANYPAAASVLYLLTQEDLLAYQQGLSVAQRYAQTCQLPLAVLFLMTKAQGVLPGPQFDELLARLRAIEIEVSSYNIPLIVLVGDPVVTMKGILHHTKPKKLFSGRLPGWVEQLTEVPISVIPDTNPGLTVQTHPISWPGPVIPLDQLGEYLHAIRIPHEVSNLCLPAA